MNSVRPHLEGLEDRCVPATVVYVDDDWAGTLAHADPDGAGPATDFGVASFATIQAAVDAVEDGGDVYVAAGTYTENVSINKSVVLFGAQWLVDPNDGNWEDTRTDPTRESILHGSLNLSLYNVIVVWGFTIERTDANEGHVLIGGSLPVGSHAESYHALYYNRIVGTRDVGTEWAGILADFHGDATHPGTRFIANANRIDIGGSGSGSGIELTGNHTGSDGLGKNTIYATYVAGSPGLGIELLSHEAPSDITFCRVVAAEIYTESCAGVDITHNEIIDSPLMAIAEGGGSTDWRAAYNLIHNPGVFAVYFSPEGSPSRDVMIEGNTVEVDLSQVSPVLSGFAAFGFYHTIQGQALVTGNSLMMSGTLGAGVEVVYGILIVAGMEDATIADNTLQGGEARNLPATDTPTGTGIYIVTSLVGAGLAVRVENNFINSWVDAVTLYDADAEVYGGLPAGASVVLFGNDLSGNNRSGVRSGGGETVDASGNWWGSRGAAAVASVVVGNVDYSPWLSSGTDTSSDPGFQGSFDALYVDDDSPQTGTTGRITEAIGLATGTTPLVVVEAGTYAENVVANKAHVALLGATGNPADVVIDPPTGNGIIVAADGVVIRDLRVTGAVNGIVATDVATLFLSNLLVDGNTTSGGMLTNVSSLTFAASPGDDVLVLGNSLLSATGVQAIALENVAHLDLYGGPGRGNSGRDSFYVSAGSVVGVVINGLDGEDTAAITGTARGDTAVLAPLWGYLNGDGYSIVWYGMETAAAYGNGGADAASLYDSAGDDVFGARPEYAYLQGSGYMSWAVGFGTVVAFAPLTGTDTAYLFDSAGADMFQSRLEYTYLTGPGFIDWAVGFDAAYGYSTAGADAASLYDSAGDDTFGARPEYAYLTAASVTNWAVGFDTASAYASGGTDRAYLYDSAGDDAYGARPEYAYLFGTGFNNWAVGFDGVYAYGSGGTDAAYLFDSAGDDVFQSRPEYAYLTGAGFDRWALGFDAVYAYASTGNDNAHLFDSAGDDVFQAGPAYVALSGTGFHSCADGFDASHAYGTAGGNDVAYLYDSAASDMFTGSGSTALLTWGTGGATEVVSFDSVFVFWHLSQDHGQIGSVDYLLHFVASTT